MENVHDTPTGRLLLIPQGAQLIGTYDSPVASGQNRWDAANTGGIIMGEPVLET